MSTTPESPALTPAPRPIDARVRRRAWADPRVRSWWISAAVLVVLALSLAVQEYLAWSRLRRAITSGVSVQAKIIAVDNINTRLHTPVPRDSIATLQFTYSGHDYLEAGALTGLTTNNISVGDSVPVGIDPSDPDNWTTDREVAPLLPEQIGPALLLLAGGGAMLFAWLGRQSVLRTFARGTVVRGMVRSNKQTPIAPRCRSVGVAILPSGRVMDVFVPPSLAAVAMGESIDVLVPPGSGRVMAAAWFTAPPAAEDLRDAVA